MLTATAFVIISLLAIMAVPIEVMFSVQRYESFSGRVTVNWLFGFVRLPVSTSRKKRPQPRQVKARADLRPKKPSGYRVLTALNSKAFARRAIRLVFDLSKAIRARDLTLKMRLGLDDPADTGRLWGIMGPISALLPFPPHSTVVLEPDFTEACLTVDGKGTVRFIPLQIIVLVLVFVFSPPALRAAHAIATKKRK